jgi:hypothetical protein
VSEVLRTASMRVELQQRASGSGKLVVEFKDHETRDKLLQAIQAVQGD